MSQLLLQDFIRLALEFDREAFCLKVGVPILITEAPKAGFALRESQTRLLKENKKTPLSRQLIRHGHMLPVREIRQVKPGPTGHVRVGRAPENDLAIGDDSVSSRHAVFEQDPRSGTFMVQDLASTNGTLVNGARLIVGKPAVLFDGDLLGFGDSSFLFFYPGGLYDVIKANLEDL